MFTKNKSPETYLFETSAILRLLNVILTEQRHQRADLSVIKRQLHTLVVDSSVQKQVTDFNNEIPLEDMAQDGNSNRD